ncbi:MULTISPECIES: hypothetical protein [Subtercola]|uniref:DUF11 domain-containing protein n=1 Tax=Subtercola vilae TaxID=2056433 RepID=A0A4T2C8R0_9MICO|nr:MULTISPECIES: hypothetical protein [Subtercola]MEA9986396.1 hypothetical protein [Subtercola sp. RTI3]TIH40329.1 hypothetical protein D4765_01880 [Subtercola vilae]
MREFFTVTRGTQKARRRGGRFAAGLALVATIGALVLVPALSSSAMEVDCSYTPGMSTWVGAGRDGIKCMSGTTGGGAGGYVGGGSSSLGTAGAPGGGSPSVMSPLCKYSLPALPSTFFTRGTITSTTDHFSSTGNSWTTYARNGRYAASLYVSDLDKSGLGATHAQFIDDSQWPLQVSYEFDCMSSYDYQATFISFAGTGDLLPGGGTPPTPSENASSVLTPLPAGDNEFLYRVNVTNARYVSAYANVGLDLQAFTVESVLSSPAGGSCQTAATFAEQCVVDSLPAGATGTFVFLVKARPTIDSTATLRAYAETSPVLNALSVKSDVVDATGDVTPMPVIG